MFACKEPDCKVKFHMVCAREHWQADHADLEEYRDIVFRWCADHFRVPEDSPEPRQQRTQDSMAGAAETGGGAVDEQQDAEDAEDDAGEDDVLQQANVALGMAGPPRR